MKMKEYEYESINEWFDKNIDKITLDNIKINKTNQLNSFNSKSFNDNNSNSINSRLISTNTNYNPFLPNDYYEVIFILLLV